jgi:hypothetical protein
MGTTEIILATLAKEFPKTRFKFNCQLELFVNEKHLEMEQNPRYKAPWKLGSTIDFFNLYGPTNKDERDKGLEEIIQMLILKIQDQLMRDALRGC